MKKKKLRYSDLSPAAEGTVPAPDPTAVQPAAVQPPAAASVAPVVPAPKPRRDSAPGEIARALAHVRTSGATDVAETLAQIEARAAAAHARELAEAEAAAADGAEPAPRASQPELRRATISRDDEWDDEDEDDAYDDRWDDDAYAQHRGPRRPLRERARSRTGLVELLMFRVGPERFAVELLCVEEAIDLVEPHHVPEMPPAMLGVITVRDTLTPVFTPDEALGVAAEDKGAALIFRSNRGRFALAIDDVDDVMTLDLAQLRDAPGIDGSDPLVLGVARNGNGIVALVDAEALIAACQATPIPELV
ncbi:MAG TPA: chemotaxis protein CheW [Gemmatimonadaceae bacterium]|nr:chemotaxis protein CheW [Gemmatimonadaceae bacterium]